MLVDMDEITENDTELGDVQLGHGTVELQRSM